MVLAFLRNELDYNRFGFVVSKRLGKAVQRNRLKRRMREATRLRMNQIKPGYDLVVIARTRINQTSYQEISDSLDALLRTAKLRL
jgi:ribonuclease P protein component